MKFRLPDHILLADVDDEAVILNTDSEHYFGLNGTALRMLHVLNESPTLEDAHTTLLQQFDADPETLMKDLRSLVEQLKERGLIEEIDAT